MYYGNKGLEFSLGSCKKWAIVFALCLKTANFEHNFDGKNI